MGHMGILLGDNVLNVHLIVSVPGSAVFPCRAPLFSCLNNRCIFEDRVLDGKNDCGDGSDEGQSGIGAKEMAQKQVPTPLRQWCIVHIPPISQKNINSSISVKLINSPYFRLILSLI